MSSHPKSHPIPQALDEIPPSRLCSFNLNFPFRLNLDIRLTRSLRRGRRYEAPPPYSKQQEEAKHISQSGNYRVDSSAIRQGPVHAKEHGSLLRGWVILKWLVLTDHHLALHVSADDAPRVIIPLSDILNVDRSEFETHALILETSRKKYLLKFKNDDDLYDWKDAISHRDESVSNPFNFIHHKVDVEWDPVTHTCTGLLLLPKPHPNFSRPMPRDVPTDVGNTRIPTPSVFRTTGKLILRVRINSSADPTGRTSVGLSVYDDTIIRDVLDLVCRKTKHEPSKCKLALAGDDAVNFLDLEDRVANLKGRLELVLITS
ncbi:hypothetical protein B0H19DRAFT_1103360 [Mycena capillaripes]|nr:hypothetical protein B0H19DRAFT_1103360 [Mycena capillaripes]